MKYFTCILVIAVNAVAFSAEKGNWPHLRGPDYDACADKQEISLAQGRIPFLWKKKLGQGYSGVVVVNDKLYTQFQDRSGQYVVSLDAATGKELWKTRYGWPWELKGSYPGTYATPTWNDGKIYFTGCYGVVGCLDADNGALLWSFDLTERYDTPVPSFGYSCTPLVFDGKVYLTLGNHGVSVAALNAETGSTVWKSGGIPASYASPLPVVIDGKPQIISSLRNHLVANDPASGKELWKFKLSEGYDEHASWPIFNNNEIFCSSPFGRGSYALRITGGEPDKCVKELWHVKQLSTDIFSPLFTHGYIFGFYITDHQANPEGDTEGVFKCVDPTTGKELWRTNETGHVNLIACGDKLILLGETGTLMIIEASSTEYKELWRGRVFQKKLCWTLPAIAKGRLFLRGGDTLVCLSLIDNSDTPQTGFLDHSGGFSISEIINNFLSGYEMESFVSPPVKLLTLWFLAGLFIFAISAVLAKIVSLKLKRFNMIFLIFSSLLILSGTFIFSPLTRNFIFTLPSILFLSIISVLSQRQKNNENSNHGSKLIPRLYLLGFIAICLAYYYCCDSFFIVSGIAFLAGLIPAIPLCLFFTSVVRKQKKLSLLSITLFTVAYIFFFWSSALLLLWKTNYENL